MYTASHEGLFPVPCRYLGSLMRGDMLTTAECAESFRARNLEVYVEEDEALGQRGFLV